jgi:hypothetical protein
MNIRDFKSWLIFEQAEPAPADAAPSAPPPPPSTPPPMGGMDLGMGGGAAPAAGAQDKAKQIRAILLKHPITSLKKIGDLETKQFNEYVFTENDINKWISSVKKDDKKQELLDYLNGNDVKSSEIHIEFSKALKDNKLGRPVSTIELDFTKDGSPTTKDIDLVFLA